MQLKNYEKLRVSANILRNETSFSIYKIAKILDVSDKFVQYNTSKRRPLKIKIIEDYVCCFDDIDFIRLRHKVSKSFVQEQINQYYGENEKNQYGLKSKV